MQTVTFEAQQYLDGVAVCNGQKHLFTSALFSSRRSQASADTVYGFWLGKGPSSKIVDGNEDGCRRRRKQRWRREEEEKM